MNIRFKIHEALKRTKEFTRLERSKQSGRATRQIHHTRRAFLLGAALLLGGARATDGQATPLPSQVALVLGGGGAKGAAYIGVLRALEEAGIPINLIAGNSAGAIAGGLYAAGFTPDSMEQIYASILPEEGGRLRFPFRGGLLDPQGFEAALEGLFEGRTLEQTRLPFYPTAAELGRSTLVSLRTLGGVKLSTAVRASMSIPGLLAPARIGENYYFDAGIVGNVPAQLARELGAAYVLAFCLPDEARPEDPSSPLGNLLGIYRNVQARLNLEQRSGADRLECIRLPDSAFLNFGEVSRFAQIGYEATQKRIPAILADLKARTIPLRPGDRRNRDQPINTGWQARLEAARQAQARQDQGLEFGLRVALEPQGYISDPGWSPQAPQSGLRAALRADGGPLGSGSLEVGLSGSLGASPRLDLGAEVRPSLSSRVALRAAYDGAAQLELSGLQQANNLSLSARARLPQGTLELGGVYQTDGLRLELGSVVPLDLSFARGHADARLSLPLSEEFRAHLRGFYGLTSPGTPPEQGFGLGLRSGLRGYGSELGPTPELGVLTLELAWTSRSSVNALGLANAFPSLWVFGDLAAAQGQPEPLAALGLGAALEGYVGGFFPFYLGLELGYGPSRQSLGLNLRTRLPWP